MILSTIDTILTVPNIVFVIGILGTIFAVYFHFKKPQEDSEIKQVITDKDLSTKATILAQKEAEGKASLLAQQVEWEKIANEKKFTEFGLRLDNSMLLATNHIHTLDVKVDKLSEEVNCMKNEMSNQITKLCTIIEERVPRPNKV
jgi:SMC interacting uncharacterized protein involved in chromosome segregation